MSDPAHVWPGGAVPPAAGWPAPVPIAPPNRRPTVVGLAAAVLILMAAGGLVHAIIGLAALTGTVDRFRAAAGQTGSDQSEIDAVISLLRVGAGVNTAVAVGAAVVLVGLALGNLRGGNRVRIATWVVCGLGLLCGCCTLGGADRATGRAAVRHRRRPDLDRVARGALRRVPVLVGPAGDGAFGGSGTRLLCSSNAAGAARGERLLPWAGADVGAVAGAAARTGKDRPCQQCPLRLVPVRLAPW